MQIFIYLIFLDQVTLNNPQLLTHTYTEYIKVSIHCCIIKDLATYIYFL